MKTLYTAIITATAFTLAGAAKTLAQDDPASPPAPPAPPVPVVILHDVQKTAEDAVHKAQGDIEKHMGEMQQKLSYLGDRFRIVGRRIIGGGKPLVVRSSDMAAPEQRNLEEDLTVMTHILDKTLAEKFADDQSGRVAMGISVSFVPGEAPMRSLYLDGYGALFFVSVNFPLLEPPHEKNVEKEKPPVDSTWEEARQEVYGQPSYGHPSSAESFPEYDAAKVSALKAALLDALKDASNIRNVQPDESITVCVIGAPTEAPKHTQVVASTGGGGGGGGGGFARGGFGGGGGGSQPGNNDYAQARRLDSDRALYIAASGQDDSAANRTTLTIRVKKADCEAFAKGKMTAAEFRSKAEIRIYDEPPATP